MTLYIIRHGETDFNKQGKVQGKIDTYLNLTGREQGKLFYEYHKNIRFDLILTSSLKRTHQTVARFIKQNAAIWEPTPDLDEISWGVHEGQKYLPELEANYKIMMNGWENGDYDRKIEGGESAAELAERVGRVIEKLKHTKAKNVLICTHGRTLLCLITLLKGQPLKEMNRHKHQNTGLYVVHYVDNEFIFEIENEAKHLSNV